MSTPEAKGAAGVSSALSVLMLGTYNSPHIEHLATDLTERGHTVHLAGYASEGIKQTTATSAVESIAEAPLVGADVSAAARWVREVVSRTGADLIHAQQFHPVHTTAAAVSHAAPLVITPWGSDLLLPKAPQMMEADKLTVRLANAFTADSQVL